MYVIMFLSLSFWERRYENLSLMGFCLEVSEESYQQEKHREEILKGRIDYLFRWLTLFISVFNIALPVTIKEAAINYKDCGFIFLYVLFFVCVCVTFFKIRLFCGGNDNYCMSGISSKGKDVPAGNRDTKESEGGTPKVRRCDIK